VKAEGMRRQSHEQETGEPTLVKEAVEEKVADSKLLREAMRGMRRDREKGLREKRNDERAWQTYQSSQKERVHKPASPARQQAKGAGKQSMAVDKERAKREARKEESRDAKAAKVFLGKTQPHASKKRLQALALQHGANSESKTMRLFDRVAHEGDRLAQTGKSSFYQRLDRMTTQPAESAAAQAADARAASIIKMSEEEAEKDQQLAK